MRRISSKLTYANVMSTIAVFVALGGGAYAASKFVGPTGVVKLCVSNSGGVKVLAAKKSKCGKGTTLVPVNQRGPAGAQGPAGTGAGGSGSTYSAGSGLTLSGTSFSADLTKLQARIAGSGCASDQALQAVAQSGTPTCTSLHAYSATGGDEAYASTAVPPGNWALFGQMTAGQANIGITVYCSLEVNNSSISQASQSVPAIGNGTVPVMGTVTTTAPNGTSIEVSCNTDGSGLPVWSNGTIVALPLAALN